MSFGCSIVYIDREGLQMTSEDGKTERIALRITEPS